MWIKICGTTNLEDAMHSAHAGADALGFVFAPSPRRVQAAQVRDIISHLPSSIETYGVFVAANAEPNADDIVRTVMECGLTGVQFHSDGQPHLVSTLRRRFAALHADRIRIISAISFSDTFASQFQQAAESADAVLIDSRTATAVGGTGKRFDWNAAWASLRHAQTGAQTRVIVAGGLNPENVQEAIQTLNPWGVDVVTGVEAAPGRKDPLRLEAFIQLARSTQRKLEAEEQAWQRQ